MAGFRIKVFMAGRLELVNVDADFLVRHVIFADPATRGAWAEQPLTIEVTQGDQIVTSHDYRPPCPADFYDDTDETEF